MKFQGIKLVHGYHDAIITSVDYPNDSDVYLNIDTCSCCNPSAGPASLLFISVRNFTKVQAIFQSAQIANGKFSHTDEIIGIRRGKKRGYILDLVTSGSLHVDAKSIIET
jgi:hypothetical protein